MLSPPDRHHTASKGTEAGAVWVGIEGVASHENSSLALDTHRAGGVGSQFIRCLSMVDAAAAAARLAVRQRPGRRHRGCSHPRNFWPRHRQRTGRGRRAELDRARADRSAAQREWDRLQRELRIARHHLETARVDDARYAALARDGTISTQRREQASNALVDADGRVATLLAAIEQARARVTALDNTVRLAESRRDKAVIVAPMSGTVLIKSIEIGELATPGRSIATLVDLTRVELRIYVPEGEIGRIRLGDPARVRTDAFPDRYLDARVARVDQDAQFTPRDIHVPDERTRLVFGVTLEIDNADGRLKPGMPSWSCRCTWNTGPWWR